MVFSRALTVCLIVATASCGVPTVPEVPRTENESETDGSSRQDPPLWAGEEAPESVAHPPPAALPEIVPKSPSETARWLDGYWNWEQNTWVWRRGGWVELQEGQRLRPSRFWYGDDGVLYFSTRSWRDANGAMSEEPDIVTPAATPPTSRLAEEATVP